MCMAKILLAEETLFKNEDAFSFDYVPEIFSFRDSQLHSIAGAVRPAMRNKKSSNLLLTGNPGTGKTTAVKITFRQLSGPYAVCINSEICSSPYRIFAEIHRSLFGFLPPETGVPLPSIYDKIFRKLVNEKRSLVVALDDVQYLGSEMNRVLYDLLRAGESYAGVKVCVIAIANNSILHRLDDKVRSVFQPDEIAFPDYTRREIGEILAQRCALGLYDGVMRPPVLEEIVSATFAKKDLRFGVEAIRKAVARAEASSSTIVNREHVVTESRHQEEGELLPLVPDGGIRSGELFERVKEKMGYTKFYRLLQRLEATGYIKTEAIRGIGNSRLIKKR